MAARHEEEGCYEKHYLQTVSFSQKVEKYHPHLSIRTMTSGWQGEPVLQEIGRENRWFQKPAIFAQEKFGRGLLQNDCPRPFHRRVAKEVFALRPPLSRKCRACHRS